MVQLLKPGQPRAHALQQETTAMRSLHVATGEDPLLTATRESLRSTEDPAQPKANK